MAFSLASLRSLLKKDGDATPIKSGVLGIDFSSSAIKFVQLRDVKGIPTLETYGEIQLGPYEDIESGRSTHLPLAKTLEALSNILEEGGATAKDAGFSIPYSSSFIATITVPTLEIEKIGPMVPVEARKYIPTSLAKVDLAWFPLSTREEENITNVLISAVYNEARSNYENVIQACGLTGVANEVEIFSSVRSVLSPKDDVVAVIDYGASSTRMYIVTQGLIGETHSVLLSGAELTAVFAESLDIEFAAAEDRKQEVGLEAENGGEDVRVEKALSAALNRGMRELHMVMQQFEKREGVTVSKILLSGGGAQLKGLTTFVQDMFSRPTVIANPFSKVAYPAFLEETLKEAGPSFAVALGVALNFFQKTGSK